VWCSFDALDFVSELVPSHLRKFLDVRSVGALGPGSAGAASAAAAAGSPPSAAASDGPGWSWAAMGERLADELCRYDTAGRLVSTTAARLIARGASQVDCDSVDASAARDADSGGGGGGSGALASLGARVGAARVSPVGPGMRPLPPPWPGLPRSQDWERLGMVVTRALAPPATAASAAAAAAAERELARSALLSPLPAFPAYARGGAQAQALAQPFHRTLTLASNSDFFVSPLVRTLTRAEELLAVGAYVHHYERYGTSGEDIAAAINGLLDVVEAYRPGGASAEVVANPLSAARGSPSGGARYARRGEEEEEEGDGEEGEEARDGKE
jgi:hypothetical protein